TDLASLVTRCSMSICCCVESTIRNPPISEISGRGTREGQVIRKLDIKAVISLSDVAIPKFRHSILASPRRFPIPFILPLYRKIRQPVFPAYGPKLIGRHKLVRRVQRSQVYFDLVITPAEHRRSAK